MFLGHFGPKKYPDLVKSWIDLGKKELHRPTTLGQ